MEELVDNTDTKQGKDGWDSQGRLGRDEAVYVIGEFKYCHIVAKVLGGKWWEEK